MRPDQNGGQAASEIEELIKRLSRLPGLGPRSARRAVLHLVRRREQELAPLAQALAEVALKARPCDSCGNVDTAETCAICADPGRDDRVVCVVEEVGDLWALERAGAYRGRYHVLGGVLSALDGVGPEELRVPQLVARVRDGGVGEVILALNATVDGQTTAHVVAEALGEIAAEGGQAPRITALARGVPHGGELDYLDDGTIGAALGARREIS
ncbi:MAG: recombination mediator RecR [Rhodobacteraceae bacterium]|nr:recombination mediator RecR [Paracoccaceae bacterium]